MTISSDSKDCPQTTTPSHGLTEYYTIAWIIYTHRQRKVVNCSFLLGPHPKYHCFLLNEGGWRAYQAEVLQHQVLGLRKRVALDGRRLEK